MTDIVAINVLTLDEPENFRIYLDKSGEKPAQEMGCSDSTCDFEGVCAANNPAFLVVCDHYKYSHGGYYCSSPNVVEWKRV